jgi:hypothetical protein
MGFGAGPYNVIPSRNAQECGGAANGIFANDASLISQHVVNIITLSADQQVAAKVETITQGVTALDASFIAQKIVGICAENNLTGRWTFSPSNYDHPSGVNGHLTENYRGYLLGDVSGDWNPFGAGQARGFELFQLPAVLSLPNVSATRGSAVEIPLRIDDLMGRGVDSYQFDIVYDPAVLSPAAAAASVTETLSEGLSLVYNSPAPGLLKVAAYAPLPASGDGVYLNLKFKVIGPDGSATPLIIDQPLLGDGSISLKTREGRVRVTAVSSDRYLRNMTGSL